jgi:hypothetical protein
MPKNIYYTKKQVEYPFKQDFETELKGLFKHDKPAKREAWNNYVDFLMKSYCINPNSDWNQPKFIQS